LSAAADTLPGQAQAQRKRQLFAIAILGFASGLPLVKADASQLSQVLLSLILNASEAIGPRPGSITLTTSTVDADAAYLQSTYLSPDLPAGRYVCLDVTDDGEGMTSEVQARLFEPYFSTRATGRGLGLPATLGVLQGHRGAVKVTSAPGKGSTVRVFLPAAEARTSSSTVMPVVVQSAGAGFDREALAAIRQFGFTPAEVDGQPAAVRIQFSYEFFFKQQVVEVPVVPDAGVRGVVNFAGVVRERGTRDPLANAQVVIGEGDAAMETLSDDRGRFEVKDAPAGTQRVVVLLPGYSKFETTETFANGQRTDVTYFVRKQVYGGYETIVRAPRERKEVAQVTLKQEEIRLIPGTNGDAFRVVQNLPGVARSPFGLGFLVIRGSKAWDTRTFVDEAPVPLLFHFGGLFSTYNSNLLESLTFQQGNYGAEYGRGTAGLVSATARTPSKKGVHGYFDVNIADISGLIATLFSLRSSASFPAPPTPSASPSRPAIGTTRRGSSGNHRRARAASSSASSARTTSSSRRCPTRPSTPRAAPPSAPPSRTTGSSSASTRSCTSASTSARARRSASTTWASRRAPTSSRTRGCSRSSRATRSPSTCPRRSCRWRRGSIFRCCRTRSRFRRRHHHRLARFPTRSRHGDSWPTAPRCFRSSPRSSPKPSGSRSSRSSSWRACVVTTTRS